MSQGQKMLHLRTSHFLNHKCSDAPKREARGTERPASPSQRWRTMSDPGDKVSGQLVGPEEPKKGSLSNSLRDTQANCLQPLDWTGRTGHEQKVREAALPGWTCDLAWAPCTCTQNITL